MPAPYRAVDIATLNGVLTSVQQLRDAVDLENEMAKETKKSCRDRYWLVWIDEIRAKSPWKSAEDDSLWKRTRVTSDTERKP